MAPDDVLPALPGEQYYVNEPAVIDKNLITASGLAPVASAYRVFRRLEEMTPATLGASTGFLPRERRNFFTL